MFFNKFDEVFHRKSLKKVNFNFPHVSLDFQFSSLWVDIVQNRQNACPGGASANLKLFSPSIIRASLWSEHSSGLCAWPQLFQNA